MINNANNEAMRRLWDLCEKFVIEQKIICPESIYQCDNVMENSLEFISKVCDIVGFHDDIEE